MLKDKKKSGRNDDIEFVLISKLGERLPQTTKIAASTVLSFLSPEIEVGAPLSLNSSINETFSFPSSKSISLRLAYTSALALLKFKQPVLINNFLASEDTRCMLESLSNLGFIFKHDKSKRSLEMLRYEERTSGTVDIGNSGVTARIILPLCASLAG